MPATPNTEGELFEKALELEGKDRAAYLDDVCAQDPDLRARLEALLQAADQSFGILNTGEDLRNTITVDAEISEAPGSSIGRYRLLQVIGEGGMGIVYMAEQTEPVHRKVALKIIKLGMDTKQVVARFEAERQALALMDHPNIAKVLDAGATESGRPYFVMELVRGVPITEYCDKNKLSTQERLQLFIPVCNAIQHAHQKGIIHRDIKPTNVMVTLHDGEPVPKVIDFGIAKATNQRLTEKTLFTNYAQMIGTPAYMSPEQAEMSGLDIDTRTDVYSLGVLLYELLTGTTPFPAKELLSLGYGHMQKVIAEQEPQKPSTRLSTMADQERTVVAGNRRVDAHGLPHQVEGDLDWIVMKSLEKNRMRRYDTVNGLVADIQNHLNDEPVSAVAPTFAYRFSKFYRKHKTLLKLGAIVALLLIASTLFSSWQAFKATRATQREREANDQLLVEREIAERERDNANQQADIARRNEYGARMLLARLDWEEGNIGRLRRTLRENESFGDLGFEWNFWNRMCQLDTQTLYTADPLFSIAVSPDERLVAAGDRAGLITIWDTKTGIEVKTLRGHKDYLRDLAFTPNQKWLISASQDQTIRIWDPLSGQTKKMLTGHIAGGNSIALTKDGNTLLSGSADRTIRFWDLETGQMIETVTGHSDEIYKIAISPSEKYFASAGMEAVIYLWDWDTKTLIRKLEGHNNERSRIRLDEFGPIRGLEFISDTELVSAGEDRTVRKWDLKKQTESEIIFTTPGVPLALEIFPDGNRIAICESGGTVTTKDLTSPSDEKTFKGHTAGVDAIVVVPKTTQFISASRDRTIKFWDPHTSQESITFKLPSGYALSISYSPNGKLIAVGADNGSTYIFNSDSSQIAQSFTAHEHPVTSVVFSQNGQYLLTSSSREEKTRLWDLNSNEKPNQFPGAGPTISPESARIATIKSQQLHLWDASTGNHLHAFADAISNRKITQFSPDGAYILAALHEPNEARDSQYTVRIWNASNADLIHDLPHGADITEAVYSPDGTRIATSSYDSKLRIWDATSGVELLSFSTADGLAQDIQFSPNNNRLLTATGTGPGSHLKLWDANSGLEFMTLDHPNQLIFDRAATFSPDGRHIAALDKTGIRIWRSTAQQTKKQFEHENSKLKTNYITSFGPPNVSRHDTSPSIEKSNVHWLLLGPIPTESYPWRADALDSFALPINRELQPIPGQIENVNSTQYSWRPVTTEPLRYHDRYLIHLNFSDVFKSRPKYSNAYAVTYLESDFERSDVTMTVEKTHSIKLYLNGDPIHENAHYGAKRITGLSIKKGKNTLIAGSASLKGNWYINIGDITDSHGLPFDGLRSVPSSTYR